MPAVTRTELLQVLELAYELSGESPPGELPPELLSRLGDLVGCDLASCARVDHRAGRLLSMTVDDPARSPARLPGFEVVLGQHPGFAAYRRGRLGAGDSVALSDLADPRSLDRLPLYTDYYRRIGTVDQLLCVLRVEPRQGSVLAFHRSRRGFTTRDRQVAELLAPHVSRALARGRQAAAAASAARIADRTREEVERAASRLASLTDREREVALLVAGGATDREIARSLGVSHRTVQKHLEQAYRKLELTNRTSLAAVAAGTAPTH